MSKLNFPPQSKAELRKFILQKISLLSPAQKNLAAETIAKQLSEHALFQTHQYITCYLAQENELDCNPIINAIWRAQKTCLLPVLLPNSKELGFAAYRPNDELTLNRYQILEPVNTQLFPLNQLDLVLVPLVGFDQQGNRLGKGGGYYDRTFAFRATTPDKKPFLLGLAYQAQEINLLFCDSWDIKLDGILTETGLVVF